MNLTRSGVKCVYEDGIGVYVEYREGARDAAFPKRELVCRARDRWRAEIIAMIEDKMKREREELP